MTKQQKLDAAIDELREKVDAWGATFYAPDASCIQARDRIYRQALELVGTAACEAVAADAASREEREERKADDEATETG